MPTPFPGVEPYLGRAEVWEAVYTYDRAVYDLTLDYQQAPPPSPIRAQDVQL